MWKMNLVKYDYRTMKYSQTSSKGIIIPFYSILKSRGMSLTLTIEKMISLLNNVITRGADNI